MQETREKCYKTLDFRNVLLATKFTCHESLYVSELRAQGAHSRASQAGMSICFIEVIGNTILHDHKDSVLLRWLLCVVLAIEICLPLECWGSCWLRIVLEQDWPDSRQDPLHLPLLELKVCAIVPGSSSNSSGSNSGQLWFCFYSVAFYWFLF